MAVPAEGVVAQARPRPAEQADTTRPVPFRPESPAKWSLFGVSLGQRLSDIKAAFPDQWRQGENAERGKYLYRTPDVRIGAPGVIAASGTSTDPEPIVRMVTVYAFNPSDSYFSPSQLAATLEMLWGTAIRFEGKRHDRLWVDHEKHVQARLRYLPELSPPQIVLTITDYRPPR